MVSVNFCKTCQLIEEIDIKKHDKLIKEINLSK